MMSDKQKLAIARGAWPKHSRNFINSTVKSRHLPIFFIQEVRSMQKGHCIKLTHACKQSNVMHWLKSSRRFCDSWLPWPKTRCLHRKSQNTAADRMLHNVNAIKGQRQPPGLGLLSPTLEVYICHLPSFFIRDNMDSVLTKQRSFSRLSCTHFLTHP